MEEGDRNRQDHCAIEALHSIGTFTGPLIDSNTTGNNTKVWEAVA
jgi:hypothetical protein